MEVNNSNDAWLEHIRSFAEREIIARDDFPIATQVNGAGRRRWLRADVSAWIERQAISGMRLGR